jgi:hypothetical protein
MRTYRHFTLPAHGAIEFLAGLAMMFIPAALSMIPAAPSFSPVALLVCALLGAILAGTSLGLTAQRPGSGRSHNAFDSVFVLVTALAALALAAAGQLGAVILLTSIVLLQAALGLTTRYVTAE